LDNSKLLISHGFQPQEIASEAKSCGPISIITHFDPALISEEP